MKIIHLTGNPNAGKTTVFNSLCGTRQRTGNYPGVTVERKTGILNTAGEVFEVVDLPGIYSLKAISPDEEVAADEIMGRLGHQRPDLILLVMDATNLKRGLHLYSQIAELDRPVLVVLTMSDLLKKEKIDVNISLLSKMLGVPVVPVTQTEGITQLKQAIAGAMQNPSFPASKPEFPAALEKEVDALQLALNHVIPLSRFEVRNLILFEKDPLHHFFTDKIDAENLIGEARKKVKSLHVFSHARITAERYSFADKILNKVEKREHQPSAGEKFDKILTHRVFGLLIFLSIMFFVFQSIYTLAAPLMEGIEFLFDRLGSFAGSYLTSMPLLESLIVDGMIAGVGSVVVFLPQIIILFLFLSVLEDSGYMARAAFLMDKLLGWSGLNGRAFIPMISSFACAVPGIMAARVMPEQKARMATILISPLMSCSARLPVYLLFISAFIEPVYGSVGAAISLFLMHSIGPLVALPAAFVLNRLILKTPASPFLLEMPSYRKPNIKNIYYRIAEATSSFLKRAGTIIFALSVIIWALSYFPLNPETKKGSPIDQSYLGMAGKFIQPVFAPLGFDWKITVGILGAFPAREVLISTLGIIYNVQDDSSNEGSSLKDKLKEEKRADGSTLYTPLLAITLMVFFALCAQCMSTLATIQKELNSKVWGIVVFFYMTALAYVLGFIVYQGGRLLGFS